MRQTSWLEKENAEEAKTEAKARGSKSSVANKGSSRRQGNQKDSAVKRPRDPNLDNEAVKLHREIIHLQANYLQRAEIADQVGTSERDLRIWGGVLTEWMLAGYNPRNVLGMLKLFRVAIDGVINGSR